LKKSRAKRINARDLHSGKNINAGRDKGSDADGGPPNQPYEQQSITSFTIGKAVLPQKKTCPSRSHVSMERSRQGVRIGSATSDETNYEKTTKFVEREKSKSVLALKRGVLTQN